MAGENNLLGAPSGAPNIIIPKFSNLSRSRRNRMEREFRTGSFAGDYVALEKQAYRKNAQKIFQKYKNWRRKPGSEYELESTIPARTYFRWKQVDPHIWDDQKNVNKFLSDNPECKPGG